jgi:DNA-binding MarR family transcriptional regulator
MARKMTARRKTLLAELETAGREMSVSTIVFHTALSAKLGLTAIEEKTVDILARGGPLTARELAKRTALAHASVTALIDRLEKKRFVRRIAHPSDGRSILVELRPESLKRMGAYFEGFARSLEELYATYSDEDLERILAFMVEVARRQTDATAAF